MNTITTTTMLKHSLLLLMESIHVQDNSVQERIDFKKYFSREQICVYVDFICVWFLYHAIRTKRIKFAQNLSQLVGCYPGLEKNECELQSKSHCLVLTDDISQQNQRANPLLVVDF